MAKNINKPEDERKDQPVSLPQEEIKSGKNTENIRSGAQQTDQLDKLKSSNDPYRKSKKKTIGSPPVSKVKSGDPGEIDSEEDKQQAWPENINPAK